MLHYQTVSPGLTGILTQLMQVEELNSFRLVGGTSLALQIGHRTSIDIDLFTDKEFNQNEVKSCLQKLFRSFTITWVNQNGFTCIINGVKADFFNWNTPFIFPVLEEDKIRLMYKEEIGAMKFEAITNRKEKKDFYDIAFLFDEFTFENLLALFCRKYPFFDKLMVIQSLAAGELADKSLDPIIIKIMTWDDAKSIIKNAITDYYARQVSNRKKVQEDRISNAEKMLKEKKDRKP